jgi:hypothetical protein
MLLDKARLPAIFGEELKSGESAGSDNVEQ